MRGYLFPVNLKPGGAPLFSIYVEWGGKCQGAHLVGVLVMVGDAGGGFQVGLGLCYFSVGISFKKPTIGGMPVNVREPVLNPKK